MSIGRRHSAGENAEASAPIHLGVDDSDAALVTELLEFTTSERCHESNLMASINDKIGRLFKSSNLAQRPSRTDRFQRAEVAQRSQVNDQFDLSHIAHKYPRLQEPSRLRLWHTLGKANAKRRGFFFYCRDHQERLTQQKSVKQDVQQPRLQGGVHTINGKSSISKPSNVLTTATTFVPARLEVTDDGFDDIHSNTTLATNLRTDATGSRLLVPLLSDFAQPGETFECPYCRQLHKFNGQKGWK